MQKNIIDTDTRDSELTLVDLDDLRAAFGGEGSLAAPGTETAVEPVSTIMCPQW